MATRVDGIGCRPKLSVMLHKVSHVTAELERWLECEYCSLYVAKHVICVCLC